MAPKTEWGIFDALLKGYQWLFAKYCFVWSKRPLELYFINCPSQLGRRRRPKTRREIVVLRPDMAASTKVPLQCQAVLLFKAKYRNFFLFIHATFSNPVDILEKMFTICLTKSYSSNQPISQSKEVVPIPVRSQIVLKIIKRGHSLQKHQRHLV